MQVSRAQLEEKIKSGNLSPRVLVYGTEELLITELIGMLRSAFSADWGFENLDASALDPSQLVASAGSMSFSGSSKLTLIRSAQKLTKEQMDALARVAKAPGAKRTLFLIAQKELKAKEPLSKWAKERGFEICRLSAPGTRELPGWVVNRAKEKGFSLDSQTLGFMIDLTAGNLMALSQMLEKLDLYRGEVTRLSLEQVEDLLQDSFEKKVYDCVDAVFTKDKGRASEEMHRVLMFNKTEGMIQLLRALSRDAMDLLKYHELKKKNLSSRELEKRMNLGARRWLLGKKFPARADNWPAHRLHRMLVRLAQVDLAIRTSGRDAQAMLEQVVIGNLAPTSVEEYDEVFV